METDEALLFENRESWRAWLAEHHESESEIWLLRSKKGARTRTISYVDSLEEALCFGWIDSRIKSISDEYSIVRWTPRRPGSNWSSSNRERAARLLHEGRLAPAGIAVLPPDLKPAQAVPTEHQERAD